MTKPIEPKGLFQPRRSTQESKAFNTDRTARNILAAEASLRAAKTARLREARLAQEAKQAEEESDPVHKRR